MTFPQTPLSQKIEIKRTTGWTDVTTPYVRGGNDRVTITRGRSGEASETEPTEVSFVLDNRTGRFAYRNPEGAYYGTFGRQTQARVSMAAADEYLYLPGATADFVTAVIDIAGIDITGDIDMRADITLLSWRAAQDLASKWAASTNNRSYLLQLNSIGQICLTWSTDGTFGGLRTAISTVPVPVPDDHRQAVRATLDVNNGAAGHTATFYTSDTIAGSWTQLGATVVQTGTTSIFNSGSNASLRVAAGGSTLTSAPLASGDPYNDFTEFLYEDADRPTGRYHAFNLYSGIAGTLVANPDFTIQTAGDPDFTDSSGNSWSVGGNAEIRDREYRAWVEVSAWPPRRDISNTDITTTIEGSGLLRRLTQNAPPLESALKRYLTRLASTELVAYWPAEDLDGSEQVASGLPNGKAMRVTGSPSWAMSDTFAASDALPEINSSEWTGAVPTYTVATAGETQTRFLLNIPSSTVADNAIIARLSTRTTSTSDVAHLDVRYNTASSGSLALLTYDIDNVLLSTTTAVQPSGGMNGKNCYVGVTVADSGTSTVVTLAVSVIGSSTSNFDTDTLASTTPGSFRTINIAPNSDLTSVAVGHISVHNGAGTGLEILSGPGEASDAWKGELAGRRFERLCSEEGFYFQRWGNLDKTPIMGNQHSDSFAHLLQECVDTDGGLLYEPRDNFGLGYRTAGSLGTQTAWLSLDFAGNELFSDPEPTDDDRYIRNDITTTRSTGSSSRAVREAGSLNVNDPATDTEGAGRYADTSTVYLKYDDHISDLAEWQVHLGTVDELRFPSVFVDLANTRVAADTALVTSAMGIDVGERLLMTNGPDDWPRGDIEQLVNKVTETLGNFEHTLVFDCAPASPWRIALRNDATYGHRNTDGSAVTEDLDTTETGVFVYTSVGVPWATTADFSGDFPYPVMVGGEEMSATAVSSSATDAFTRSVSNGWGTADAGGAWTNTNGAASEYAVTGTKGRHAVNALNSSRYTTLVAAGADTDQVVTCQTPALATGASQFFGLVSRWTSVSDFYVARVTFTTAAAVRIELLESAAGVLTTLAGPTTVPDLTHVAATDFTVRFLTEGTRLSAKVWLTSATEPSGWQITVTDATLTAAGSVGCRSTLAAGNTNTLPFNFDYDNYDVPNPQLMTVTRSVNGVVKTHSSGAAMSLARPVYRGL